MQWLETGERDFAAELAELVLANAGKPDPASALALARKILRQRASSLQ